jgi:predicted permease
MDSLINIVFPVFGIIVCGFLSGHLKLLDEKSAEAINKFVYYIALPPLLFLSTASSPFEKIFHWPFIGAYMCGILLTLLVTCFVARFFFQKNQAELTILALATVFANTAYMGIPVFMFAFGKNNVLPAIVATLAASVVLLSGTVAVLEWYVGTCKIGRGMLVCISTALLKNTVVMSLLAGIVFGFTGVQLPDPVKNFLSLLGNAAGPVALFSIGLSLVGKNINVKRAELMWIAGVKLFIHPLATWFMVSFLITMERAWANAAVILAAMPIGALVYVFAQQYKIYVGEVSAAIVVTTAGSVVTLSAFFFILGI